MVVANKTGSATGTGVLAVNAGTLGGGGVVIGAVTVGTGTGTRAFLAPAAGSKRPATFTTASLITFNSQANYTYRLLRTRRGNSYADLIAANGVIISNAKFTIQPRISGALQVGTVFSAISNTSANPISGAFTNLPDGGIITINGNNLQADYAGGDGNDLTLTVIP